MSVLQEEARFLVAKYGTAAGPTGLPAESFRATGSAAALDAASVMVLLGFLILFVLVFVIVRDMLAARELQRKPRYMQ